MIIFPHDSAHHRVFRLLVSVLFAAESGYLVSSEYIVKAHKQIDQAESH